MNALVTGGNGFLGRYVVEQLLARGDSVRVLGRNDYPELRALGVACFRADLAAEDDVGAALRGCDAVFHVAAKAGVWGTWDDFYRNNVTATQHILRAAVRAGVPKFVYTSSPSVAIGTDDIAGGDESLPFPARYSAPYPHTKALAERWVLRQPDILTVALRPHLIWGPRDPHIVPQILARARAGRLRRVGDGTNLVDVTYVENGAEAHLQAADSLHEHAPARGQAYFIGQAEPVNMWAFIDELVTLAGLPPVRGSISPRVALPLASFTEWVYRAARIDREPPLTRMMVEQMSMSHWFSHAAAARDFGYVARISTAEGLRRTVEWFAHDKRRERGAAAR
jgi:nucleoside-diphosphate-sugar epimerase